MTNNQPCESCTKVFSQTTIDDFYNQTLEKLTSKGKIKQTSSQLMSLATNHERVLFVYNILKELKLLPQLLVSSKDDNVSMFYRCQGNEYFKRRQYYEAWQSYNLSLLYAVTTSENFIFAVSNRSAVFFGMEKYIECLEDIKFVLDKKYPEKIKQKLLERKAQCLTKVAAQEAANKIKAENEIKIEEILKLKSKRDKKYVCASSKLKVVYTEELGRHVIANEDIAVGEVLAEEYPYLTVLLRPEYLFCCAYCLRRNMNLYPCTSCTYTLYCSAECRETARKKYHVIECGLLSTLLKMGFSKMDMLALRALLRSRTDEDSWLSLFKVVEQAVASIDTEEWGCVKVGDMWIYDSRNYNTIHTLSSNIEKRTLSDIFRKSLCAAFLTHLLSILHFLNCNDEIIMGNVLRYVSGTLLLHIMTSPTNMHSISTTMADSEGKFVEEYQIASGAYGFLSLLNHSCAPNVVRYTKLGTARMSLIAVRPIKKGMQVFDNYGYHHAVQDRQERQSNLKFQYKFTCTCEACVDDWAMHARLSPGVGIPAAILKKKEECLTPITINKLMTADLETAFKCYKPLCELVEALDGFAPCKELAECQESLKQCLAIFHGVVPYDQSRMLKWTAFAPCTHTADQTI